MAGEAELLVSDPAGLEPGYAGEPGTEHGDERFGHHGRFQVTDGLADRLAAGLEDAP